MRVIVVGLGVQGRKRAAVAGTDLVATVDPTVKDANHRDIGEIPSTSYDAALLCTPDAVKFGLIERLLAAGKHVLVEKPLLGPLDDLRRLRDLAKDRRTTCYTAYNHRFEPHIATLREILATSRLGRLYAARLFYGNGTARLVRESAWRDTGSGVLPDLGSHLLDIALFLFGSIDRTFLIEACHRFENAAPDHVRFASEGTPAMTFETTLLSWRNSFHCEVVGEAGSAHIESLCKWGPSRLVVRDRKLPSGRPDEDEAVMVRPDPTWELEYRHFLNLTRTGEGNIDNDIAIAAALSDLEAQIEGRGR